MAVSLAAKITQMLVVTLARIVVEKVIVEPLMICGADRLRLSVGLLG